MRYTQKHLNEIKRKIPEAAFSLLAERGIESVTMQNIADACELGVATIYRYYGTKQNLVIQVCAAQWDAFAQEEEKKRSERNGERFTARQEMEFYLDACIDLYREHKDLLRFHNNFELYVLHEKATPEDMRPYYEVVSFFRNQFCRRFSKAGVDHTIRTDIPEQNAYYGIVCSMLYSAAKYAQGIMYPPDASLDHMKQLELQKQAYLDVLTSGR